jgi:hypothetical protein
VTLSFISFSFLNFLSSISSSIPALFLCIFHIVLFLPLLLLFSCSFPFSFFLSSSLMLSSPPSRSIYFLTLSHSSPSPSTHIFSLLQPTVLFQSHLFCSLPFSCFVFAYLLYSFLPWCYFLSSLFILFLPSSPNLFSFRLRNLYDCGLLGCDVRTIQKNQSFEETCCLHLQYRSWR